MRGAVGAVTGPVGRLAPSPTGFLHLGHARSFLLAWWQIRSRGGRIVLRIEDLDRDRCRAEYVTALYRDLEWLGLDWDGEPLVQSHDTQPYESACERLLAEGFAYPCVCSRAEVEALSAPHSTDRESRYPGTCRGRWGTPEEARLATGRSAGVRIVVPEGEIAFDDALAGPITTDVQREVGDFLIRRRDGAFAYQLAVVVDDARQRVDTILRGADLLPSTARQHCLQAQLGLPHPTWFHVPLVVDATGERLAKRRADLALNSLRERGVDARAVVAWAARVSGQDVPKAASAAEVTAHFDLLRTPRHAVVLSHDDIAALLRTRA